MENACNIRSDVSTDEQRRMIERVQQGFHCSEILLFAGLEAQGKTNPDLIRTMSALAGGVGFSGELCGALTGGACLIGLYSGRGNEDETTDSRSHVMISELMDWFAAKFGVQYGGLRCREITEDDPKNQPLRCPRIVGGVLKKVKAILAENDIEWNQASSLSQSNPSKQNAPKAIGDKQRSACPCSAQMS